MSIRIRIGEEYGEINKTIGIIITNYKIKELKGIEELKEKWAHDEATLKVYAKKQGKAEGIKQEKIETAKKMKEKKMDVKEIIEITGLTKEEIEKL